MAEPYGNYDQSNERIDPIPQPQLCLDGLVRHIQAYENTIASLTQENKDLRDQLARTIQQLDILRAQAIPTMPQLMLQQQSQHTSEAIEDDGLGARRHDNVTTIQIKPPGVLPKQIQVQQQQQGQQQQRRIYMHTREIIQLDVIQQLLMTGSRDGTCRFWRMDDPANKNEPLQTLRTPGKIQAVALLRQTNAIAIATDTMRVYMYSLDAVRGDLGEYAQISDLTSPLIRGPGGDLFLQLGDPISAIAEVGRGLVAICGAGYIAMAQIDQSGFQLTQQQTFSENNLQSEPLYFSDAVTLGQYVYVIVKERFLLKGQYISATEQINPSQQNIQRVSARLLQVSSNMRATPFTLAAHSDQGEMTPVSVFTADGRLYLLFQQWEHKLAVFDPQTNTFAHVKEANNQFGINQPLNIMCGCTTGKQCYIIANTPTSTLAFIYELNNDQITPVRHIEVESSVSIISRVRVEQNALILGGLDGSITFTRL